MNTKLYMLSQEEIDELVADMLNYGQNSEQLDLFCSEPGINATIPNFNSDSKDKCTDHKWKTYQGLNESFDYCTVCDLKK